MRVYSDVISSDGSCVLANGSNDAAILLTPPAGEYVRINWVQWALKDSPSQDTGFIQIRDITLNKLYVFAWLSAKTTGGLFYDLMSFDAESLVSAVNSQIEVRLGGNVDKALAVSYR
jgi:hypothetical protein